MTNSTSVSPKPHVRLCVRARQWNRCPAKTETDRMIGQHAHPEQHRRDA